MNFTSIHIFFLVKQGHFPRPGGIASKFYDGHDVFVISPQPQAEREHLCAPRRNASRRTTKRPSSARKAAAMIGPRRRPRPLAHPTAAAFSTVRSNWFRFACFFHSIRRSVEGGEGGSVFQAPLFYICWRSREKVALSSGDLIVLWN